MDGSINLNFRHVDKPESIAGMIDHGHGDFKGLSWDERNSTQCDFTVIVLGVPLSTLRQLPAVGEALGYMSNDRGTSGSRGSALIRSSCERYRAWPFRDGEGGVPFWRACQSSAPPSPLRSLVGDAYPMYVWPTLSMPISEAVASGMVHLLDRCTAFLPLVLDSSRAICRASRAAFAARQVDAAGAITLLAQRLTAGAATRTAPGSEAGAEEAAGRNQDRDEPCVPV